MRLDPDRLSTPSVLLLVTVVWWIPVRAAGEAPAPIFTDESAAAGLDFVHTNGMSGELYFVEITGPGVALFDFDNDGDLDVYLGQGHMLGAGKTAADATLPVPHPPPFRDRLYRNDLEVGPDGSRRLRFTDVTAASGLDARGYSQGVATGDVDNDGWTDLYITNFGDNQLWRNRGAGADGRVSFENVTERAAVGDRRWSVAALFFDVDRDGWLDLFVANYTDFALATHKACRSVTGRPTYCGPTSYRGEPDRLLRNRGPRGDGAVRFEDVTRRAGLRGAVGPAFGAVILDADRDGWLDLYVANDAAPNHLWRHRGGAGGAATFVEDALLAGCALSAGGVPEASMGVSAADYDGDGDEDLLITHLLEESNTVYANDGSGLFEDVSIASGLAAASWAFTGFGAAWIDYDNDGRLDALMVNGEVKSIEALAQAGDPYPLHQTNQLFHNLGPGADGRVRLTEVTARAGAAFEVSEVSRAAAVGDLDNDGDTDVVVGNNSGPARLWINRVGQDNPWLGLRLLGSDGRRDMLGAWVGVFRRGRPALWRRVRTDGSFASANDPRLLFGLGDAPDVERIVVRWPDGAGEQFPGLAAGRYHVLRQGTGRPAQ